MLQYSEEHKQTSPFSWAWCLSVTELEILSTISNKTVSDTNPTLTIAAVCPSWQFAWHPLPPPCPKVLFPLSNIEKEEKKWKMGFQLKRDKKNLFSFLHFHFVSFYNIEREEGESWKMGFQLERDKKNLFSLLFPLIVVLAQPLLMPLSVSSSPIST